MIRRRAIFFKPNLEIPLRGQPCRLVHRTNERGVVEKCDDELHVFGDKAHFKRRLVDWLKQEAADEISHKTRFYAAELNKKVNRISIKDTTSQWGSCSGKNNLSFSWRLILAPADVLDYVVAHEVCHLEHMNHSKDFWDLLGTIMPEYSKHRYWLKKDGLDLMRYQL
ncbi:MAG: M48 family metallopeptidase [Alphaproteobacteria bacterium]